jgi:hypothetical protein
MEFPKNLELELPYDSTIQLLGIYLKEMKSVYKRETCIPKFIVALFTIVELWNQPRCLSSDEWIKKIWHVY